MTIKAKATHTPGPWKTDGSVMHVQGVNEPLISHGNGESFSPLIAQVHADGGRLPANANALLIAAAPTMKQTLFEELDALRVWLGAETNADITDGMFASIAKIQYALEMAGTPDEHKR